VKQVGTVIDGLVLSTGVMMVVAGLCSLLHLI
jgi:hypothetical protein